jgi:hypothetical protein
MPWCHYLLARQFRVLIDNWANKLIHAQPHLNPKRQARLVQCLQDCDFRLEHIPGTANHVANALSKRANLVQFRAVSLLCAAAAAIASAVGKALVACWEIQWQHKLCHFFWLIG